MFRNKNLCVCETMEWRLIGKRAQLVAVKFHIMTLAKKKKQKKIVRFSLAAPKNNMDIGQAIHDTRTHAQSSRMLLQFSCVERFQLFLSNFRRNSFCATTIFRKTHFRACELFSVLDIAYTLNIV